MAPRDSGTGKPDTAGGGQLADGANVAAIARVVGGCAEPPLPQARVAGRGARQTEVAVAEPQLDKRKTASVAAAEPLRHTRGKSAAPRHLAVAAFDWS